MSRLRALINGGLGLCLLMGAWLALGGSAVAAADRAPVLSASNSGDNEWQRLSAPDRTILAPLAPQWSSMSDDVQDKWISVARRYPSLSPDAQGRVRERMKQWSQTSSRERSEARLRFQNAREIPVQERQQKWQAYQALSPQQKAELARQAQRKQKPVALADSEAGPRELTQATAARARATNSAHNPRKANVVPAPPQASPAPQAVAPAVVKAGPGATTTLVTQSTPKPPLHQHTGLPRIAATKTFVDPQTMLPKKGSQGAAMTPVAASAVTR